ncbi:hypothetical protein AAG906_021747 [Vitis piasezkii]
MTKKKKKAKKSFIPLLYFASIVVTNWWNTRQLETYLRMGIHKETIQLIKMYNEDPIYTILHFSTNIICFLILSGYSILGNEELLILNSWIQQIFLYNLNFRFAYNHQIISGIVSTFSTILYTILKYWIF